MGITQQGGDREKPGAERAAKLILVYYVPPKRCHAGSPPWTPKQKQSSIAPGFSWSPFSDTHERLDTLALDKQGSLVLIENKLDDTGRDVTWQALKYALYCSRLSKENVLSIYQEFLAKTEPSADAR